MVIRLQCRIILPLVQVDYLMRFGRRQKTFNGRCRSKRISFCGCFQEIYWLRERIFKRTIDNSLAVFVWAFYYVVDLSCFAAEGTKC
jgi:hypothetical protein